MIIQAVSLWQPWASLVAYGEKLIETRSWPCPWPARTILAIHAAKKWNQKLAAMCLEQPFREALGVVGVPPPSVKSWTTEMCDARRVGWNLPFGQVVALVRLGNCLPSNQVVIRGLYNPRERSFGDYSPGRWCWFFDRVHRLAVPIPGTGRQGVWNWEAPDELAELVRVMRDAA